MVINSLLVNQVFHIWGLAQGIWFGWSCKVTWIQTSGELLKCHNLQHGGWLGIMFNYFIIVNFSSKFHFSFKNSFSKYGELSYPFLRVRGLDLPSQLQLISISISHSYLVPSILLLANLHDRFPCWSEIISLSDKCLQTIVHAFITGWVSRLGVLTIITMDRGKQLE